MSDCTCYLGHPDDPDADEEACAACAAAFWSDPVFMLLDGDDPVFVIVSHGGERDSVTEGLH